MAFADRIDGKDVQVGDTICVVGSGSTIFHNMMVTVATEDAVRAQHINSEGLGVRTERFTIDSFWRFYLVERPKKPLPTHFGAKVKVAGEEYVLATADDSFPWIAESGGWYSTEEMEAKDWKEA